MANQLDAQNNRKFALSSVIQQIRQEPHKLTQLIVICGVFLLSILLVQILPQTYLLALMAVIIGLGAMIVYLQYLPLGIVVLLIAATFVPFEIGTNTGTSINLAVVLIIVFLGIWIVDMVVRQRKLQFVTSRPILPLLVFGIVVIISFGVGQLKWFVYARSAPIMSQIGGLAIFILSISAFILFANIVKDEKWLKRISWVFLILGAIFLFCRLLLPYASFLRVILPNGMGGSLLYVWMAALILSFILFNKELTTFSRIVLVIFLFVFLYATVIYTFDWKSGWIPPMAALLVIFLIRYPRFAIVVGIIGLLLFPTILSNLISTDEYSYSTRLVAWEIILKEIVKANPILGLGPANYYYYTPLYPILGYSVQFNSHNNYIDILAQSGIVGLACFFWFFAELGFLAFRLLKKELSSFARAYVIAVIGGLVGTLTAGMLGDWVLPFVYNIGLRGLRTSLIGWMLMAGLVVIEQIYSAKAKTTTS